MFIVRQVDLHVAIDVVALCEQPLLPIRLRPQKLYLVRAACDQIE